MKKVLLLSAAALTAASAMAGDLKQPQRLLGTPIQYASYNGRYAAYSAYGVAGTYDLSAPDGDPKVYADENGLLDYQFTSVFGSAISNDGIAIGATNMEEASILDIATGQWSTLPTPRPGTYGANAITPDGSMIVGFIHAENGNINSSDDNINSVPCIWTKNERGRYANVTELPYPEKDFTGRVPVYVLAQTVSPDGQYIGGQVVNPLHVCSPIYWRKKSTGEWEYVDIAASLMNPGGIVFPEWVPYPDDSLRPEPEDYMTAEEKAAYKEAEDKAQSGEGEWPDFVDFMTDEEYSAYEAAAIKYNKLFEEAETAQEPWWSAFYEILDNAPMLEQNQTLFNGHEYVGNATIPDPNGDPLAWMPAVIPVTSIYNIVDKKWRNVEGFQASAQDGGNNLLGYTTDQYYNYQAIALKSGADKPISFVEWLGGINSEYVDWLKENMSFDFVTYEQVEDPSSPDGFIEVETEVKDYLITGMPFAAQSFNLVAGTFDNMDIRVPDYEEEYPYFFSYLLPLDLDAEIESIGTDNSAMLTLSAERGGLIRLAGDAKNLRVYDLQGRVVFEQAAPASEVSTGLTNGIFIVKAEAANGAEAVTKAIF